MDSLHNAVQQVFNLEPSSYILKKYDRDFEDFVDIEEEGTLVEKDKVKVVLKIQPQEPQVLQEQIFSHSLTFRDLEEAYGVEAEDPPTVAQNLQKELKLRTEPWPLIIKIPTENFSKTLRDALDEELKLSWNSCRELITCLADLAYS